MAQAVSQVQVSIVAQIAGSFTTAFQTADKRMAALGQTAAGLNQKLGDIGAYRRQQNALKDSATAYQQARQRVQELKDAIARAGDNTALQRAMQQSAQASKQAASEYQAAKDKVTALAYALKQAAQPTREQREALKLAKEEAKAAGEAYRKTKADTEALARQHRDGAAAAARHQADLKRAEADAKRLGDTYQQARTRLAEMGRELQRNGVDVGKLSSEYRRLQGELATTTTRHQQAEASLRRQQAIVGAMAGAWQKIGTAAAGITAAGAVLARPTQKALTYEEQLAYMTDTAGAGKPVADKLALQKQISDSVEQARQFSRGATREDVATALQTMIASGKFSIEEAMRALPDVARTAFAGGAKPEDIANSAVSMKVFGIKEVGPEFDKMLRAGQVGSFELKNMAQWLPQQLALAKASGYHGRQGITDLLAYNQVSMQTASTPEDAGNNVVNLLQKFSSREFSKSIADAVQVRKGDPTQDKEKEKNGKKVVTGQEFSWSKYLMRQREQGVGAVEAFASIMERQLAGNKDYQRLQERLKRAGTDEERKATLGAMSDISLGTEVGKIIADRQALMFALASLYGKKDIEKLKPQIDAANGTVSQSAEYLGGQNFAKSKMLAGNVSRANEQAYGEAGGALGGLLDKLNSASQEFPKLTTAVYSATVALGALAAAGAGAGLYGTLTRARAASTAANAATTATTAAGAAGTAASVTSKIGMAGRVLGVGGLVFGAANATTPKEDAVIEKTIIRERVQMDALRQQYGQDVLEKAYRKHAPWYQVGGVNNARPEHVQQWVEQYVKTQSPTVPAASPTAAPAAKPVAGQPPAKTGTDAALATANANASSTAVAAQEAAKAAQEAAKAATIKPNVNITNSYNLSVTANQPGAVELGAQLEKSLREIQRKADADARAKWLGNPGY